MPLWFEEGYAVYAAGEWDLLDALSLNYAVVAGSTPGLDSLNRALRGHPAGISTAYALSASAVLELARRNPTREPDAAGGAARSAGEAFDSALGHDRADAGELRRGVAARRPASATACSPGWRPAGPGRSSRWH